MSMRTEWTVHKIRREAQRWRHRKQRCRLQEILAWRAEIAEEQPGSIF